MRGANPSVAGESRAFAGGSGLGSTGGTPRRSTKRLQEAVTVTNCLDWVGSVTIRSVTSL